MLYYIPLSILPIALVALIMSGTYENLIISRTLSSASDNSYLIINQVESILDATEDCGNLLTININKIYNEKQNNDSPTGRVAITNAISNELSFALLTFTNIESLAFYDMEGRLYTSTHRLKDSNKAFFNSSMHQVLDGTTGPSHWFPMTKRDFLVLDPDISVLTMGKKIVNINTGTTYGYLLINISESYFHKLLTLQEFSYWIIHQDNTIV